MCNGIQQLQLACRAARIHIVSECKHGKCWQRTCVNSQGDCHLDHLGCHLLGQGKQRRREGTVKLGVAAFVKCSV